MIKSIIALLLLVIGSVAAGAMMSLQGRIYAPERPGRVRALHRVAGYLFVGLVLVLAVLGSVILRGAGDALPLRGVLHWVLGSLLVIVVLLKVVLVRYYKKFLKMAPALGLTILVLALLVAVLSAGYVFLTGRVGARMEFVSEVVDAESGRAVEAGTLFGEGTEEGDPGLGASVFEASCAGCHLSDSEADLVGPGLKGLFGRERLEVSRVAVNRETVREQILRPAGTMPEFGSRLTEREVSGLIAYLETL